MPIDVNLAWEDATRTERQRRDREITERLERLYDLASTDAQRNAIWLAAHTLDVPIDRPQEGIADDSH